MNAVDFVMYCAGTGILVISVGVAIRLTSSLFYRTRKNTTHTSQEKIWEPISDPASDGLAKRLVEFQTARYASPILQRSLSEDAGPRQRSFSQPQQPQNSPPSRIPPRIGNKQQLRIVPRGPEKVVQFPKKLHKNDSSKKED